MTLKVKKLDPRAKLPTVAHPGTDLGYDLFALDDTIVEPMTALPTRVRTGIALEFDEGVAGIIKDRSSVAASLGLFTCAGVIDSGYRGEVVVLVNTNRRVAYMIAAGQKIAQIVPVTCLTGEVEEIAEFTTETARGDKGFGSSGN